MKKIAVIGLGDIAPIHLDAIKAIPEIMLAAVCDIDPEKQKNFNGVPFYTDYMKLLEEEKPDCVHLCLPHYLHYTAARTAVLQDVHVFCEKPMAMNRREAQDFVKLEEEHPKIQIGICLQNRKNRTIEQLKEMIESGRYGCLTGIRGFVPWKRTKAYYEEKPWRKTWEQAGSGVLLNQAVHTLDLLSYLGGEIRQLKAISGQILDYDIEVEDTVAAKLTYQNSASGLFLATNANYRNEAVSIQVELEDGEFLIQNNVLFQILSDGSLVQLEEDQRVNGTKFYYGASHQIVIREFYQSLVNGSGDYIHVRDAWQSMVLSEAIFSSSRSGKSVIVK